MIKLNWYARFYYDVPNKEISEIIFIADSKYSNKYRYAVIDEDEEHYYIALKLNDINCREVCKLYKGLEGTMFYLKEE
ncbi:MAG: hypothetical protein ACRDD7_13400 [Peptostreptococcaceae bacterium]